MQTRNYEKYDLKELLQIHKNSTSITSTAKAYCKKYNLEYSDSKRRGISSALKNFNEEEFIKGQHDADFDTETKDTETNQYEKRPKVLSAINPETGKYMDIWKFCDYWEIPRDHVRSYKAVNSQNGGIPTYNIASNILKGEYFEQFYRKLLDELSQVPNRPKTILRNPVDQEEYLLIVDPCDIHIGKLAMSFETGEDYNNQIAVQRVHEGVEGLLDKTKGFRKDKILFIGGNDILHVDTPQRTTSNNTPQDTDGMWYTNFLIAKQLYIDVLIRLMKVADVHFVYNPSNHDYMTGFFLSDVIQTYFKDCKNITFDCDISHRKYFTYYKNLIGTTHGDGAKIDLLPQLMSNESKHWSSCKHRYIYTHHVHSKTSKDSPGCTVESMRSPTGADGWHHRKGYQFAPKAIEGFIHSKEYGQISRITNIF